MRGSNYLDRCFLLVTERTPTAVIREKGTPSDLHRRLLGVGGVAVLRRQQRRRRFNRRLLAGFPVPRQ